MEYASIGNLSFKGNFVNPGIIDKAVKKYEYLMVYFYAPWCIRCNKFHPEYEEAATILKKENLFLAKVDATVEKQLDKRFKLKGFPVIKLFIRGKEIEYKKEDNGRSKLDEKKNEWTINY